MTATVVCNFYHSVSAFSSDLHVRKRHTTLSNKKVPDVCLWLTESVIKYFARIILATKAAQQPFLFGGLSKANLIVTSSLIKKLLVRRRRRTALIRVENRINSR